MKVCPTWSTSLWPGRMLANSFCLFGQLDIDHVGNHFHLMSFLVNKHLTNWDHDYFRKATCLTGQQAYWPRRPTLLYGLIGVFIIDQKGRKNYSFFCMSFLVNRRHPYILIPSPPITRLDCAMHGPACIAFHCSHLYITNPGCVCHFAKTWMSLQTTTYISKSTKYFDILLLLTCEKVLHAPTVRIWAQNSTILTPNYLIVGWD